MSVMMRLLAMALLMSALLAGMVITNAAARAGGTEIRLEMMPVDPRDFLLGHYVELETPLHRLWLNELTGDTDRDWNSGDRIWVGLDTDETGAFQPVAVYTRQPEGLSIQGRVFHAGTGSVIRPGAVISVRYNLERYFASPEDALALEELRNESRLRLIVSVGSDGSALIRGLEIDGEDHIDRLM